MRVAILGIKAIPATGGADRVVERLLLRARPDVHFWVYVVRTATPSRSDRENVSFVRVPAFGGRHLRPFVYFLLCALHVLVMGRYDVAHVHNSDFGLFCPALRLRRGLRVVGTFHGDPYRRAKWGGLARLYLRMSELVFAQSCHHLTSVSRFKPSVRGLFGHRAVEFLPNGMDEPEDEPEMESVPSRFGLEPGRYILFACGRLDRTKGLHHLLQAYAAAACACPLLAIGDFGHDPAYSERIRGLAAGLPGVILYPGLLPRGELLGLVRRCGLFAFPSEVEAMSMMLLEAVSCRAPVLCSDIPENLDVVGDGYPYAFSLRTRGDLAAKLTAALADAGAPERAERLRADLRSRLDWGRIEARYEALYDSRPASRRAGRSRFAETAT